MGVCNVGSLIMWGFCIMSGFCKVWVGVCVGFVRVGEGMGEYCNGEAIRTVR